jgi:hypothetical protein
MSETYQSLSHSKVDGVPEFKRRTWSNSVGGARPRGKVRYSLSYVPQRSVRNAIADRGATLDALG